MEVGKFVKAREKLGQGSINLLSDTIKFCIVDLNDWALSVSGATNATPIVITTSTAHGLTTGDEVVISGVVGNTAANGLWKITVLTTTTFELDGSTGNGAYTSGGWVVSLEDDEFLGDIPVAARIATSSALASKTITRGYFDSANPLFTAPTGDDVTSVVLYKDTGNVATSPIISVHNDSASFPLTLTGDDVEVVINDFIIRV